MVGKIEIGPSSNPILQDHPIIPYIEGDGVGPDIWRASVRVFDAAIRKCYGTNRKVHWVEVYAGEKAFQLKGEWAPEETIETIREHKIGIKGPLRRPHRSLPEPPALAPSSASSPSHNCRPLPDRR